jgi:MFS family permease
MALFAVVGLTLYGLPTYYDFFVTNLHWKYATVQSGNFVGKVLIGPLFGLLIGYLIDRKGPRGPMIIGMLLAGAAVAGLGGIHHYGPFLFFYLPECAGLRDGGPAPQPGAAGAELQGEARCRHGRRLRRHRHRLLRGAAPCPTT